MSVEYCGSEITHYWVCTECGYEFVTTEYTEVVNFPNTPSCPECGE